MGHPDICCGSGVGGFAFCLGLGGVGFGAGDLIGGVLGGLEGLEVALLLGFG